MILKMVIRRMKNRKKTTLIMLISLLLSLFFVSSMSLYRDNQQRFVQQLNCQRYGKWQGMILKDNAHEFDMVGKMDIIGTLDNGEVFGSFDDTMFELAHFQLLEGRYPQNEHEIVLTTKALDGLGKPYQCQQTISLTVDDQIIEKEVVGILPPYENNWKPMFYLQYPSIITTNLQSEQPLHFVYDKDMNASTYYDYSLQLVNDYAYPSILSREDNVQISTLAVFDLLAIIGGFAVVLTVFIQQLYKRQQQIQTLCMLGIRESVIIKESFYEGIVLSLISLPISLVLSMVIVYVFFSRMTLVSVKDYYHIPLLEMIVKCLFMVFTVLFILTITTKVILIAWNRQTKTVKKTKKKRRFSQLGFNSCLFIFILISTFLTMDVINKKDFYFRDKLVYETSSHYQFSESVVSVGLHSDEEEMDISELVDQVNGKSKKEIDEIQKIYGIDKIAYEYIIPCAVSLDQQFDAKKSTIARFHTLSYSREELSQRGVDLSDEEYDQFIKGETAVLALDEDTIENMKTLHDQNFIYDLYHRLGYDAKLDLTIYSKYNGEIKPVNISNTKTIQLAFENGKYYFKASNYGMKDILCSEKFIEKHFGLKDGPYQEVNVRASNNANYTITDKKMSEFEFFNNRIGPKEIYENSQSEFIVTLGQYIIFMILFIALFINIWNGYLNVCHKNIGMMQTIGVRDAYIYNKYWRKTATSIVISTIASFVIHVIFQLYNYYLYLQSALNEQIFTPVEAKQAMKYNIMNWYTYYRSDQMSIIIVIAIVLIITSYLLTKKVLNEDIIKKINEE